MPAIVAIQDAAFVISEHLRHLSLGMGSFEGQAELEAAVRTIQSEIQNVISAADAVAESADDTGCTEDMTVCSKAAVEKLTEVAAGRREVAHE